MTPERIETGLGKVLAGTISIILTVIALVSFIPGIAVGLGALIITIFGRFSLELALYCPISVCLVPGGVCRAYIGICQREK